MGIQLSTAAHASAAATARLLPTPIVSAISEGREAHRGASPVTGNIPLGIAAALSAGSSGKGLGLRMQPVRVGSTAALEAQYCYRGQ